MPETYDYSLEAQAGFIEAYLDQLAVPGKITLVVHDIGGIMGIPWAARHVDRLAAVIYTNTVAFPRVKWFPLAYRYGNDSPLGRRVAELSMAALSPFHGGLFRTVFARQNPQLSALEIDRFVETVARLPGMAKLRKIPARFLRAFCAIITCSGTAATVSLCDAFRAQPHCQTDHLARVSATDQAGLF